ncbi:MAG: hypothetical protein K2X32_12695 [Phycisphaerales bacterium]|nr:hypothetical protein [Phycisphaerales bacterium]
MLLLNAQARLRSPLARVVNRVVLVLSACVLLAGNIVIANENASAAQPAGANSGTAPAASVPSAGIPAARYAEKLVVITIDRPIDSHLQASFERRLREAEESGASGVIVELDTPGGEVGAVLGICNAIKRSKITNIVAWVRPTAYSGGALIALACREMIISDGATMGDALVITMSFGMLNRLPEGERQKVTAPLMAEVVNSARLRGYDEKLVQGVVSLGVELWMIESVDSPGTFLFIDRAEYKLIFGREPDASSATLTGASPIPESVRKQGEIDLPVSSAPDPNRDPEKPGRFKMPSGELPRDPDASPFVPAGTAMNPEAQASTDRRMQGRSNRPTLSAADQGKWKVVEYVADGRGILTMKSDQLFRYGFAKTGPTANGTINTDEELRAFTGAKTIVRLDMNWAEKIGAFLDNIVIKGILVIVFLLAMFIEMTHPGVILPGVVAVIALVLLIAPSFMAGFANWWAVVAVVAGILCIAAEIFILPGFGVFGILGLIGLFGGLVGLLIPAGGELFPQDGGSSKLLSAVATLSIGTVSALVGMYFVAKYFGSLPLLNRLVLQDPSSDSGDGPSGVTSGDDFTALVALGDMGTSTTPLRPSGRARFGEDLVDVVSEGGFIGPDQPVRVIAVEAMRVVVEKA